MQYRKLSLFLSICLMMGLVFTFSPQLPRAEAATITVTNTNDTGAGSLRQAILDAAPGDIIDFSVSGTITLTSGTLTVNKNLVISGPTSGGIVIDGNGASGVITIAAGSTVTLENLTIRNGSAMFGGGINNSGILTLRYSSVINNVAAGPGGGGIYGAPGSTTTVINSTLSGNSSQNFGGGAFITGASSFQYVTITNNFSDLAYYGRESGGIAVGNGGSATITGSILSDNYGPSTSNEVNCLAAGYPATGATGTLTSGGYNLVGDGCGMLIPLATDLVNTASGVSPLGDNGGVTPTHALTATSAALDQIPAASCTVPNDQRGTSRPQPTGANCDIGAFEVYVPPSGTLMFTKAFTPSTVTPGQEATLTITLSNLSATSDAAAVTFSDALPAGLILTAGSATGNCGGALVDAGNILSLSGGAVAHSTSCTVTARVSGATIGTYVNQFASASSSLPANDSTDTATLTVSLAAPTTSSGSSSTTYPDHSAEDNARAQAPLCQDLDGSTNPIIRADVPSGTVPNGGVFCRVLAENSAYVNGPAEVGDPAVIQMGVIQAVDVFGMAGNTSVPAFTASVKVCLSGSGRLFYLNATTAPRQLSQLSATPELGYTCGLIPAAGTVVLVP
jgi:uncharacterized repeat protein (TIGR01451 family)